MVLQILLLVVGFVILIKGADWFVDGASAIAKRLRIPSLIIGLTIVAMGTSLPEAAISISAALRDNCGIAVGNVQGSNILNILLILGITAAIKPMSVQKSALKRDLPILLIVSLLVMGLGLPDGSLDRLNGVVLAVVFIGYLVMLFKSSRSGEVEEDEAAPDLPVWKSCAAIVVGAGMIVLGSNIAVEAATKIAQFFGMSDRLIGLTIIAFGTSLPELVTSCVAARKGETDIAVGNIVGSNLFNLLFVLGSSALITPVAYPMAFLTDSIISLAAAVLLFLLAVRKQKLTRGSGLVMLGCFAVYYTYLFLQ